VCADRLSSREVPGSSSEDELFFLWKYRVQHWCDDCRVKKPRSSCWELGSCSGAHLCLVDTVFVTRGASPLASAGTHRVFTFRSCESIIHVVMWCSTCTPPLACCAARARVTAIRTLLRDGMAIPGFPPCIEDFLSLFGSYLRSAFTVRYFCTRDPSKETPFRW
jgi:hypothetical protein